MTTRSIWCGERVRLRGTEPGDWQTFMHFDTDSTVMRNADQLHPPRSAEGYRRWADSVAKSPGDDEFFLAVEALSDGRLVGAISTDGVDKNAGVFGYGISIGSAYHRSGYASEAIILLLRYMFGERRFQKCDVGVYAYNTASLMLHKKLGFIEEGRRRRSQYFAGQYHDVVLLGMTVEEYLTAYSFVDVRSF